MPGPQLKLTLQPNGVVAPALRAAEQSIEILNFFAQAVEKADLSKPGLHPVWMTPA